MDSSSPIEYENLVQSYRENLEVQTRGFSLGAQWLEMWVPDEDVVACLRNMVEAAHFAKMDNPLLQLRSRIWNSGISIRHQI